MKRTSTLMPTPSPNHIHGTTMYPAYYSYDPSDNLALHRVLTRDDNASFYHSSSSSSSSPSSTNAKRHNGSNRRLKSRESNLRISRHHTLPAGVITHHGSGASIGIGSRHSSMADAEDAKRKKVSGGKGGNGKHRFFSKKSLAKLFWMR
jgi:hypothetical protein